MLIHMNLFPRCQFELGSPKSRSSDLMGGLKRNSDNKWTNRVNLSFELEDGEEGETDSDTTEVIYYPPSETDSNETSSK